MNSTYAEKVIRQVSGFDQVSIRGNTCSAQVFITQGEGESLAIEAPPDYMSRLHSQVIDGKLTVRLEGSWLQGLQDALATGFNRPQLIYRLGVRQINYLEVQCAYFIHSPKIETPHLRVKLNGTGDFRLDWLSAKTLEVYHSGSGTVQLSGQVDDQTVVLNGIGSYIAPGLDSQRAHVRMTGTGMARIHVDQALDATLRGVGCLEYSGDAIIRTQVSGPGQIFKVEKFKEKAPK